MTDPYQSDWGKPPRGFWWLMLLVVIVVAVAVALLTGGA